MANVESSTSIRNIPPVIWIVVAAALMVIGSVLFLALTMAPGTIAVQASAEAQQVDTLLHYMVFIGGIIFLLVQGILVFSVIRFRAKPGDMSDGAAVHGNPTLELVWTAIPALIVLFLAIISFQVWVDVTSAKDNEQVVDATGVRFAWSFNYDIPGREDQSFNTNVLHTYVNQPVHMVMNSPDVIHSFYIPAMRIKQDVIPGRTTEIRFTPTLAGEYPVLCAELCGSGHGDMRATILVHEDEAAYMDWFDEQVFIIDNPPEDPAELGLQLLSGGAYPCNSCHTLDALGWTGITGPTLNGIGDRAGGRIPGLPAEEYLSQSIYAANDYLVPGFGALMLAFQHEDPAGPNYMSLDDHRGIVAYLCTQTASGESACDLDNLDQIIASYE